MDRAHAAVLVAPRRFEFRDFAIPETDEHAIALLQRQPQELRRLCTHAYPIDAAATALQALGREVVDGEEAVHVHLDCTGGPSP